MVPSCARAGELKMMSPVAYDHLRLPSRPTAYTFPSCEPTSTEPSAAIAGEETTGPAAWNAHETSGLTAGSTNGDRPRWVGPNRNIDWAGSVAYCGNGSAGVPVVLVVTDGRLVSAGQTHRPASQRRLSLQSRSPKQGLGSTVAQVEDSKATSGRVTAARREELGRRAACNGQGVRMAQG